MMKMETFKTILILARDKKYKKMKIYLVQVLLALMETVLQILDYLTLIKKIKMQNAIS
jgi:hypothetical protein